MKFVKVLVCLVGVVSAAVRSAVRLTRFPLRLRMAAPTSLTLSARCFSSTVDPSKVPGFSIPWGPVGCPKNLERSDEVEEPRTSEAPSTKEAPKEEERKEREEAESQTETVADENVPDVPEADGPLIVS